NIEDKILVPKPPKNCARCAKCGHPVNGPYCQGCALLREKLEEDLVSYFQNFQNTSESSDNSTNVVNAPQEPFVVKQDHGVKSSQNPYAAVNRGSRICVFIRLLLSQPRSTSRRLKGSFVISGDKDTFKSTSGGAQFLGEKLVSWSSKKQECTALSTAEAKYVSLSA
nr:uncharacterized mitochondrial protein AtMg00810-like [Tanacetum cinerariifolium]